MKTLIIKDLPRTEALDAKAMTAVRGGMHKEMPSYWTPYFSYYDASKKDSSLSAFQSIGQNQQVSNANGNNVAFASGITSNVSPVQKASNNLFSM